MIVKGAGTPLHILFSVMFRVAAQFFGSMELVGW